MDPKSIAMDVVVDYAYIYLLTLLSPITIITITKKNEIILVIMNIIIIIDEARATIKKGFIYFLPR